MVGEHSDCTILETEAGGINRQVSDRLYIIRKGA